MLGSGGTRGGFGLFAFGFLLAVLGIYLFFDSVRVTTAMGMVSGMMRRGGGGGGGGGGFGATTSMGILFVPFLVSVIALFYDSTKKWAWWLLYIGLAVITIEILSRIRFFLDTKLTHLLGMMVLFAAGVGLMIRSYREASSSEPPDKSD